MAEGSRKRRTMSDYSVAAHAQGTSAADGRMERYHQYVGRRRAERRVWPGAAFVVEALLLLVFLTGSLAVLMELNADADQAGRQSADLLDAIVLASNVAEEYSADPVAFEQAYASDPESDRWFSASLDAVPSGESVLRISCDFIEEETGAGAMHYLTLEVWQERVLSDPAQMMEEGVMVEGPGGRCFQRWDEAPVYTLETAAYVPGGEGVVSRG